MSVIRALRAVCLVVLLGPAAPASAPSTARRPDVFLITIDTLRADHIHCYGYDRVETPGLDGLAKDGTRFTEAFTPSPITNSSHASILTGLLPGSHGVTDFAVPLSPAYPTVAELLKKQSYHTAAFIGAVILDSKTQAPGFDRGFDFYDNFPEPPTTKSRWGRVERRGTEVVRHAEEWLNRHPTGAHFVWLHLYDPHDPYEPPQPFSREYKDHLYDGEIAYADYALANFVAYLKKIGHYENSIVVVVGDHGEGLGEHHEETHGIFLYDSTMHVPLIIKQPQELDAGLVVSAQVMTIDILPTILELVGAAAPGRTDGESVKTYFVGAKKNGRPAFGETDYPLSFGWASLRSVRGEGFKYIEAPRPEFYDLRSDAAELDNKYEPWNNRVQEARAMLEKLRAVEHRTEVSKGVVGPATVNELRALGYLGPVDAASATTAPEPSMLPDPKDKIDQQNLLHAAMIATEDNRDPEARKALEKVLVLDPNSPIALRQLGELELRARDYDEAVLHLRASVEARPNDAAARFHEGQALVKTNDLAAARDTLENSLKLSPEQLPARLLLGEVFLRIENPSQAEDEFEAALLLEPDNAEAQLGLARAQIAQGNFAEAVRHLEPLSRMKPRDSGVFETLATAYAGLGRTTKAQIAKSRAKVIREHTAHPSDH